MRKVKIAIVIFLSLIVTTLLFRFSLVQNELIPENHTALILELKQSAEGLLSFEKMELIQSYPSDYKINLENNYYKIVMKNQDKVLFTGKVTNRMVLVLPPPLPGDTQVGYAFVEQLKNLKLYLPYYKSATKIDIHDESDQLKLSIPIDNSLFTKIKMENNLCGNNVCDFNENIISCYADCRAGAN